MIQSINDSDLKALLEAMPVERRAVAEIFAVLCGERPVLAALRKMAEVEDRPGRCAHA